MPLPILFRGELINVAKKTMRGLPPSVIDMDQRMKAGEFAAGQALEKIRMLREQGF